MNNKGYIMTETLIVSGVVLAALVLVYTQFARINSLYADSYVYNTVNDLYTLNQIGSYVEEENTTALASTLENYTDITNCSSTYFTNTDYCKMLFDAANIKYLIFTYNDKTYISGAISKSNPYDLRMQKFIKTIDDSDSNYKYRLVAEFKNGTYASIPLIKNVTTYANGTAIYFNPVTGQTCTDYVVGNSTTGTKTGCMKWYIFNDDGSDNVNLILDHNTTAGVSWNSSGSNISGPSELLTQLSSDTSSWSGLTTRSDTYSVSNGTSTYTINYGAYRARLITAAEIAKITGNNSFSESTAASSNWFYFDSNSQTQTANSIGASKYAWLYDYTNSCTSNGCNIDDSSTTGYWTATSVAGSSTVQWEVRRSSSLDANNSAGTYGVRPVITVNRSTIQNRKYADGTAVYYNPETGQTCDSSSAVSTTGTKTGCMKWYIFGDSDGSKSLNLILDHNTTANNIPWNNSGSNATGPSTAFLSQFKADTSTWKGVPTRTDSYSLSNGSSSYTIDYNGYKARLITANEITNITGNTSWNLNTATSSNYYYFDSNSTTQTAKSKGASKYSWLYDYTYQCTSYGCNNEDDATYNSTYNYAYWISDAVYGATTNAWLIARDGYLASNLVTTTGYGIRPVITIPKYTIQ